MYGKGTSMKENKEEQQKGYQHEWGRRGNMTVLQVLHLPVFDDVV